MGPIKEVGRRSKEKKTHVAWSTVTKLTEVLPRPKGKELHIKITEH